MGIPQSAMDRYSIIIVGGGTAGCVLANRLSEDPDVSVLLLEAGQDHNDDELITVPGLASEVLGRPDYDWQYETIPQDGLEGRIIKHPRGKMIGGSSAINYFAMLYPSPAALDAWADLGNPGWSWKDVSKYYRKFVTVWDGKHSDGNGPIQATVPADRSALQQAWFDAFASLGVAPGDPRGEAVGPTLTANHITKTKERSHAGSAYLAPASDRPNLTVRLACKVKRIEFEQRGGQLTATGVIYDDISVQASSVILCGGAIASPQLLELSGVGDPRLLSEHGISVLYANPHVGENLQDHLRPLISFEAKEGVPSVDESEARRLYESSRTGPWTAVASTFAYVPLMPFLSVEERSTLVDLMDQLEPRSAFEAKHFAFVRQMVLNEVTATGLQTRRAAPQDNLGRNWITFASMLSHPLSRGSVHIASSRSDDQPRIDPKYYSHPFDLELHARHLQSLLKIARAPAFTSFYKSDGALLPARSDAPSVEEAKELVREHSSTNYHLCGTCSMMPEDVGGVVNERLIVYGTANLRVVDASVIPIIPRGNIVTSIYAIAEKAADMISEDLGIKRTS